MRPSPSRQQTRVALFRGALIGLIVAASLVLVWNKRYTGEPSLYLLGSGKGLSALVTAGNARVLIIHGDNPDAFATAFGAIRPLIAPRLDLLIITPGATRVARTATAITRPRQTLTLFDPATNSSPASPDGVISRTASVELGDGVRLQIDRGFVTESAIPGWSLLIETPTNRMLLAETLPIRPPHQIDLIAVMGAQAPPTLLPFSIPIVLSAAINDAGWEYPGITGRIATSESVRIRLGLPQMVLPGSWRASTPASG